MVDLHTFLVYKAFCKLLNYRYVVRTIYLHPFILKEDIKRLANTLPSLLP